MTSIPILMKSQNRALQTTLLHKGIMKIFVALLMVGGGIAQTDDTAPTKKAEKPEVEMADGREELKLPGIKVNLKERYVDVDATVCLTEGLLELIACAKDTKEHESIIALDAKAAHVHAALLLLGTRPGNPARRMFIEGEEEGQGRWIDYPPRGEKIDVFLVVKDEEGKAVERPINDFLIKEEDHYDVLEEEKNKEIERFPTNTFLFAGSHIYQGEQGPAKYLADVDGNVISISTFGDELLCLPDITTHGNDGLVWGVDSTHLPEEGTKVILRLRPQLAETPPAEKED